MNLKKNIFFLLPFLLFAISFTIHYFLIIEHLKSKYWYFKPHIKQELLQDEYILYRINLIGDFATFILQIIGTLFVMNIGLIYYENTFKFKELLKVILKSSIFLALIYFIIPIVFISFYNDYSFNVLYKIESEFTLYHFMPKNLPTWQLNISEMFSLTQIFYILSIIVGFKKMMAWQWKKSILFTSKIYGISFMLWVFFSSLMDLNFYR